MKYGILGCGKHALQSHAIPGRDVEELDLVAICDISEKQLTSFEQNYGGQLSKYTDRDAFLKSDMDAVLIGTPDEFHFQDLKSVIDAGLHAFVEKPLGVTSKEVRQLRGLLEYAENKALVVSSCHPRRYDPPFMWLKKHVLEIQDDLGAPLSFGFDFSYHKPSKDWKHSRGLLLDHANHEIDLMHYLFGYGNFEATKVSDSFDQYQIVGLRSDGISFNFAGTRRLDSRKYLEWAHIRFEKGDVMLDTNKGIARIKYNHDEDLIKEIPIPRTDYGRRGKETMLNFAKAISGTEENYLSNRDLYVNTAMSVLLTENDSWEYYS